MHRRLIREAQKALQDLGESGTEVRWGWPQGHIGLEWNDVADKPANRGRGSAEEGPPEKKSNRRKARTALIVEQLVDAEAVRKAAMSEPEACRWARSIMPNGDGTATVQTHYVRSNPFSRRNAEGVSLQFCSKELRERIAGRFYVELDIKSSHPTMLRTRLARYRGASELTMMSTVSPAPADRRLA